MQVTSILVAIFILYITILPISCKIVINFQRLVCINHDPTTVANVVCSTKAVNRTTTRLNVSGNLTRVLYRPLVHFKMNKKAEIIYRPFILDKTENYCDFFEKNIASKYMRIITSVYMPFTNMNHSCPYLPGPIYIRDLWISAKQLPSIWVTGNFRLDASVIDTNRKILTIQFFLESKEDNMP